MNDLMNLNAADTKIAEKLAANIVTYKDDTAFHLDGAEDTIFQPIELPPEPSNTPHFIEDQKDINKIECHLLTREQEHTLFLRLNYCKFKVNEMQNSQNPDVAIMVGWYKRYLALRTYIAKMNLRIVTRLVFDFVGNSLDINELTSEANLYLLQAIDGMDASRNIKFSTYAYHAITRSFWKKMNEKSKITDFAPVSLDAQDEDGGTPNYEIVERPTGMNIEYLDTINKILAENTLNFTELELNIIKERYLATNKKIAVIKVAEKFNLSVGVVNEIEKRVLGQLRKCLENV